MRIKIAFDLDGTLVRLPLDEMVAELAGKEPVDRTSYSLQNTYGVTRNEIDQVLDEIYNHWHTTILYPGAKDLLTALWRETKDPITIVTARKVQYATQTHELVKHIMGKVPYVLIFSGGHGRKARFIKNFPFFVEDRRKTAIDLASRGHNVFLPDHPFNQMPDHKRIHRIDGIKELLGLYQLFIH